MIVTFKNKMRDCFEGALGWRQRQSFTMRKDMFTPVAFVDNTVDDSYLVVSLFFPIRDYSALNLISRWHISQSPWVISFRNPTLSHIWYSSSVWGLQLSEIISHVTVTRSSVELTEPFLQTPHSSDATLLSYLTGRRNFSDKQPTTWQRHEMG